MNDMHVHTEFSSDCAIPMSAYLPRARELGVATLCFTDHVDHNPNDLNSGHYDADGYFKKIAEVRGETNGIKILAGIEFDCPHSYPAQLARLAERPYDCIIGSVHYCGLTPDVFFSELVKNGTTAEECYAAYWREVQKCVALGGFDVLGHIDIPKRYYKTLIYGEPVLREIFRVMLKNNITLEINTSSLAYGCYEPMPGRELLKLYKAEGGEYVTVGSDAHSLERLGLRNDAAQALIREFCLREVVFINRRRTEV